VARGFDSKAVEEQIAAAERDRQAEVRPAPTAAEKERQTRREGLRLSRTRTLTALQGTCDPRYRALLERTLAHIDEELAAL
jgi:hypothetical protein